MNVSNRRRWGAVVLVLLGAFGATRAFAQAQIQGRIVDASQPGVGITGSVVLFRRLPGGQPFPTNVGAQGLFSRALPAGHYTYSVNAPNFLPVESAPAFIRVPGPALTIPLRSRLDTTFIVLRHAEKAETPPDNPPLTQAGRNRAEALVRVVRHARVDTVFHSSLLRSQETVQPLAQALGLTPIVYDISPDVAPLAQSLLARRRGSVALVAAHSNTIGPLIEALGGSGNDCLTTDDDFDNFCIVTLRGADRRVVVRHLQYGAASGP
jgi:broad specificity phosphatase PhoE